MAKGDKDKKSKKGKDTVKLPRRVAGVKVSKAVRQAGKSALKFAAKPAVSETVAAALLAAAAALRDPPATKRAAGAAAGAAGEAGRDALKLGDSIRKVAIDVARRTLDAWESADPKPASAPHEARPGNGAGTADRG